MKQLIKQIFNPSSGLRSVGIYTFSNFFSKGVSFLLLLVYTNPKYITPSQNGLLNLFGTGLLLLMPFISMGTVFSTSAEFYKLDKKSFKDFLTTGFVMPLIVMGISMLVLFYFREELRVAYGFPYSFTWIIPLITFFTFCNEQLLAVSRNNNQPGVHLKSNIGKTIIELGLSFVLVVFFGWQWKGRIAGIIIAYFFIAGYSLYYFIKNDYLFGSFKISFLKKELAYAIPIITVQASIFCMSSSDKFFLSHFTNDNNSTVGIYGVACVFGSVIIIMSNALIQYFYPKLYSVFSETFNYPEIKKQFVYYAGIMLGGTVGVVLFIYIVYNYFLNIKYVGALSYIFLICTGYFLWCITYFFYSFLLYNKEKKKLFVLSAGNIVISLVSNYFFIKYGGAYGAATAICVTYSIVLLYTLFITRNYLKLMFPRKTTS